MSFQPYSDPAANEIYALLFGDEPDRFVNLAKHWPALFADPANEASLAAIAGDESLESRVRSLAYGRLRNIGKRLAPHILLGAVIEVGLDVGLDVLAAYSDGGVRYINATGKISIFEAPNHALAAEGRALLAAAQDVVNQIGPTNQARLPPPAAGAVRMSFIVSDGLYFGEGKFEDLQRDRLGGPVARRPRLGFWSRSPVSPHPANLKPHAPHDPASQRLRQTGASAMREGYSPVWHGRCTRRR